MKVAFLSKWNIRENTVFIKGVQSLPFHPKHLYVYKKYDYENHKYIYELRSVKNKPHENHTTIDEILEEVV